MAFNDIKQWASIVDESNRAHDEYIAACNKRASRAALRESQEFEQTRQTPVDARFYGIDDTINSVYGHSDVGGTIVLKGKDMSFVDELEASLPQLDFSDIVFKPCEDGISVTGNYDVLKAIWEHLENEDEDFEGEFNSQFFSDASTIVDEDPLKQKIDVVECGFGEAEDDWTIDDDDYSTINLVLKIDDDQIKEFLDSVTNQLGDVMYTRVSGPYETQPEYQFTGTVEQLKEVYARANDFNSWEDMTSTDFHAKDNFDKLVNDTLSEADDREPLSHALDIAGIKASTANLDDQDQVEVQGPADVIFEKMMEEAVDEKSMSKSQEDMFSSLEDDPDALDGQEDDSKQNATAAKNDEETDEQTKARLDKEFVDKMVRYVKNSRDAERSFMKPFEGAKSIDELKVKLAAFTKWPNADVEKCIRLLTFFLHYTPADLSNMEWWYIKDIIFKRVPKGKSLNIKLGDEGAGFAYGDPFNAEAVSKEFKAIADNGGGVPLVWNKKKKKLEVYPGFDTALGMKDDKDSEDATNDGGEGISLSDKSDYLRIKNAKDADDDSNETTYTTGDSALADNIYIDPEEYEILPNGKIKIRWYGKRKGDVAEIVDKDGNIQQAKVQIGPFDPTYKVNRRDKETGALGMSFAELRQLTDLVDIGFKKSLLKNLPTEEDFADGKLPEFKMDDIEYVMKNIFKKQKDARAFVDEIIEEMKSENNLSPEEAANVMMFLRTAFGKHIKGADSDYGPHQREWAEYWSKGAGKEGPTFINHSTAAMYIENIGKSFMKSLLDTFGVDDDIIEKLEKENKPIEAAVDYIDEDTLVEAGILQQSDVNVAEELNKLYPDKTELLKLVVATVNAMSNEDFSNMFKSGGGVKVKKSADAKKNVAMLMKALFDLNGREYNTAIEKLNSTYNLNWKKIPSVSTDDLSKMTYTEKIKKLMQLVLSEEALADTFRLMLWQNLQGLYRNSGETSKGVVTHTGRNNQRNLKTLGPDAADEVGPDGKVIKLGKINQRKQALDDLRNKMQ